MLSKRRITVFCLVICFAAVFITLSSESGWTQVPKPKGFPSKNMEYVIGWGAGGGSDAFGRLVCIPARRALGVPLVVVNMPGAASATATEYVYSQPADGHTLFGITNDMDINFMLGRTKLNPLTAFTPIIRAHVDVGAINISEKSPGKTWQELVDFGKKNPGKLTIGGAGSLTSDERWGRQVFEAAGVKVTYVPYEDTGEMHAALLGGHISAMYDEPGVIMGMIEKGAVKPVMILAPKRLSRFPDVPCTGELGLVLPMMGRGIAVKRGTPDEIVTYLEYVFTEALKDDTVQYFQKKRLLDLFPGYANSKEYMKIWEEEFVENEKGLKQLGAIK